MVAVVVLFTAATWVLLLLEVLSLILSSLLSRTVYVANQPRAPVAVRNLHISGKWKAKPDKRCGRPARL